MLLRTIAICVNIFILSNILFPIVSGETGCPPPEDILPCTCSHKPTPRLECVNIFDTLDLIKVSENSERYTFQEVHIKSSTISYIPRELVEKIRVNELYLENSKLEQLFDFPPKGSFLYKLHIENSKILRIKDSNRLKSLTSLRILYISGNVIRKIDSNFTENFPKSLKEISLVSTGTNNIEIGAFNHLINLDKVVLYSMKLNNITRDVFPRPFNARFIYLDNNSINKIPKDLFTDMPNLQFLSMRNNQLSEFPQSAFEGRTRNVPYVRLEGNPLKCNCLLVWLIRDKPEIIGGTCATPKTLHGKDLKDLRPGDFNC